MADKKKKTKNKILTYQNYLEVVKASQGSRMFRRLYVLENKQKKDILKDGELSCAYYVSSILKIFDLISKPHATVKSTIEDMFKNSWRTTKKLRPGNVLVWEKGLAESDKKLHLHIGFYLGKDKAICSQNRDVITIFRKKQKIKIVLRDKGVPHTHHFTYGRTQTGQPKRKIIQILTHRIIK